jgi:hypothetical protein
VTCAARLVLLAVVGVTANCDRATRLDIQPLADGEWIIVHASERGGFLRKTRDMQPRRERQPFAMLPEFVWLGDTLTPVRADTFSLAVGATRISFVRLQRGEFFASLTGQPVLQRSPVDSQLYAFEHDDAIWVLKAPDTLHKLTLDYDLDTLRTRQREGAVILYWSVNPVWSGDGKFIAFNSNRESVRTGAPGQSLWIIDAYTGVQRPVYDIAGESVHVEGAFGEEFVFISNQRSGVFAVHPRTRAVRKLGDGYVLARHPRGAAILLNNNGALTLLRGDARHELTHPPAGEVWSTQAAIAPSGHLVAIYSTDQAGSYTLNILGANTITPIKLPALPSHGPAWFDDRTIIFSVQERGNLRTYRAVLR